MAGERNLVPFRFSREVSTDALFPGSRLSSYLPEPAIRPYLAVAAGLYGAAFLGGVYAPPSLRNELADLFMAAAEPYINQSGGVLFLFILANNLIATILILVLGVAFGISYNFV